jgi:MFS family permease
MQISILTKITLLLLVLTTMMSNVAVVTVIPHLKDIFPSDNIEFYARLMITLPSLMIAILASFLGHLIYKIGKKKSTLFALVLFGSTGTAGLYLNTIENLLISRALLGIAIAMLMIVSTSLVGDYFEGEDRHRFMGLQSAFTSIGGVFFVVGGGVLVIFHGTIHF